MSSPAVVVSRGCPAPRTGWVATIQSTLPGSATAMRSTSARCGAAEATVKRAAAPLETDTRGSTSSMNGAISLAGVTGGIDARTVNGSINISHVAGPIEAKATNGTIEAVVDSLGEDDPIVLEGVNGSMTAVLPADVEAQVQLSTVNGGIRSDFAVTTEGELSKHRLRGQIGSSSREVVLKTVNGNVSLLNRSGEETALEPPRPLVPARRTAPRSRS